jgi:pyrroloquinoline quinone (PQQ) biosynthesis protein C
MGASQLEKDDDRALRDWWDLERKRSSPLTSALLARPESDWTTAIIEHPAHRHRWYDALADEVSVQEFATFLLENWAFPAFLPLVERTLQAQISDEGRAATIRNIEDEQIPVPHADLMRRLIHGVKAKAGDDVPLSVYPSLVDRTLVFYYGYYCNPWHLVGALYVTEAVAYHRLTKMGAGLTRLGLEPADLEFIRVHLACDEDHAREWSDDVIASSVRLNPSLRESIAEGIAACLDTSARYLDEISQRASRSSATSLDAERAS